MFGRRDFIRFFLLGSLISVAGKFIWPFKQKRHTLKRAWFWKKV